MPPTRPGGQRRGCGHGPGTVALLVDPLTRHEDAWRLASGGRAADEMDPTGVDEGGHVCRHGQAADEQGAVLDVGPRRQDLPHVGVGRAGLLVEVVAVVPPGDEPEAAHGRVGRGARADDDPDVAAQHLEPRGVAGLRPLVGRQPHVLVPAEHLGQSGVDTRHVALVGHDDDAAPAREQRGSRRLGEGARPVARGRARGPGQPGCAGRLPCRDPGPPRGTGSVAGPHLGRCYRRRGVLPFDLLVRSLGLLVRGRPVGRGLVVGQRRRLDGQCLLRPGVPRRDRQPQHVHHGAGLVPGDPARQLEDLRREHLLRRDDGADRRQSPGVLGDVAALDDVAGEVTPREAGLDPHTRLGGLVELLGHEVLEGPVEMDQPRVDEDLGDAHGDKRNRVGCQRRPTRSASVGQRTAACRASTLVVCSHGKGLS